MVRKSWNTFLISKSYNIWDYFSWKIGKWGHNCDIKLCMAQRERINFFSVSQNVRSGVIQRNWLVGHLEWTNGPVLKVPNALWQCQVLPYSCKRQHAIHYGLSTFTRHDYLVPAPSSAAECLWISIVKIKKYNWAVVGQSTVCFSVLLVGWKS